MSSFSTCPLYLVDVPSSQINFIAYPNPEKQQKGCTDTGCRFNSGSFMTCILRIDFVGCKLRFLLMMVHYCTFTMVYMLVSRFIVPIQLTTLKKLKSLPVDSSTHMNQLNIDDDNDPSLLYQSYYCEISHLGNVIRHIIIQQFCLLVDLCKTTLHNLVEL